MSEWHSPISAGELAGLQRQTAQSLALVDAMKSDFGTYGLPPAVGAIEEVEKRDLAGIYAYEHADSALIVSIDALNTIAQILRVEGMSIPAYSLYHLLRVAHTSALAAWWVLGGNPDPKETARLRRLRGLSAERDDIRKQWQAERSLADQPDGDAYDVSDGSRAAARQQSLATAAREANIPFNELPTYPTESSLYTDHPLETDRATGDLATYRVLSGAIHGKYWSLFMHERRTQEEAGPHGLMSTEIRIDLTVLVPLLQRSVSAASRTMDLRERLGTAP